MAKINLKFDFIPMPAEVIRADPPLIPAEWIMLAYLLKQLRFGEALRPISDDELMNGIFKSAGVRKDSGCGLSRNSIKTAREALSKRGWIAAENINRDPTRPRWQYLLNVQNEDENGGVKPRQLVSKLDSAVSKVDSTVSKLDSAVSKLDTCNKEEEKPYRNTSIETAVEGKRPPQTISSKQANLDAWDLRRWQAIMKKSEPQPGVHIPDPKEDWRARVRDAAFMAGIPPDRIVYLLKQHFPQDDGIDLIYSPPQLFTGSEKA